MSKKINCLEISRNGRLCAGAEAYEKQIASLQAQLDAVRNVRKVAHNQIQRMPDNPYGRWVSLSDLTAALDKEA